MSTYASSIPGASGYAGAALLAQKAYSNAMSRYQQQRGNILLKYGYKRDASGHYGVDPSNEFGQYQQMLGGEATQTVGLNRAQASSGWGGGSGFLGQQREDLMHQQGAEQTALGTAFQGDLTDIAQGEQGAAYDRDAALYQAQEQASQAAIDRQQFDPGSYAGLEKQVPYPAGVSKAIVPKGKAPPKKVAKPVNHAAARAKLVKRQAARRAAAKKSKKGRRR